jgi:DNA replication protein DnaC
LKTEVDSRDSHGGQGRIKAARFPARKTLEEFDFTFQTSLRPETVLHLGRLTFDRPSTVDRRPRRASA